MRLFYVLCAAALTLALVLAPGSVMSYSSGAPPGASGSPLSSIGDCSGCHGDFEVNSGTGSITIDAPTTFVPGDTITFTVTIDNTTPPVGTPRQGFEVSVEEGSAHVGTLVLVDEQTEFAWDDERFVTHATSDGVSTWTVGWAAPEEAPETVTIYAAGNAANGNSIPTGDYIYTTAVTLTRTTVSNEDEATPLVARVDAIYPNPFARAATVDYTLERSLPVTVTLYDGLGRTVRVLEEGLRSAGAHAVQVEGRDLPAGVYFVEVRTPETRVTRPLTRAR